jgi:hypothetical protein
MRPSGRKESMLCKAGRCFSLTAVKKCGKFHTGISLHLLGIPTRSRDRELQFQRRSRDPLPHQWVFE